MTTTTHAIAAPPHPVVTAGTHLMYALWAAECRGLPMPFSFRGFARRTSLQFHLRADVEAWAAAMDTEVFDEGGYVTATGVLLDVPLTVCAYVAVAA